MNTILGYALFFLCVIVSGIAGAFGGARLSLLLFSGGKIPLYKIDMATMPICAIVVFMLLDSILVTNLTRVAESRLGLELARPNRIVGILCAVLCPFLLVGCLFGWLFVSGMHDSL